MKNLVMTNEQLVETLNHLIELSIDAQIGYLHSASGTNSQALASVFQQNALQREAFVVELSNLVISLGGEPASNRSATGMPSYAWLDIRTVAEGDNRAVVLQECERGEDAVLLVYDTALASPLPENVRNIIQNQYEQIVKARGHIGELATVTDSNVDGR